MQDNIFLVVRPPNDVGGFYTIEDAATERAAAGFRRRAKKRQQRDAAGFARANDTGRAFM